MTKFITPGDLIEGKKCHVVTRKYETKRLQRDPITKKPMLLYELDRNCSIEITECLQLSEDDLNLRVQNHVGLGLGDCIEGDAIQMYVDCVRPIKFIVKEGQSGRHGANLVDTKKRAQLNSSVFGAWLR